MAGISTTLELVDHISGKLMAIGNRVQALADGFGMLDGRISGVQARMERFRAADVDLPQWELPEIESPEIRTPEIVMRENVVMQRVPTVEWSAQHAEEKRIPLMRSTEAATMAGLPRADAPAVTAGAFQPETGMEQGISSGMLMDQGLMETSAVAAANAAVTAVQSVLNPVSGMGIGAAYSIGLARGIRSGMGAVISAARAVASAAVAAARSTLGIHSPSRAAREIGGYFGAGFAGGIADSRKAVSRAVGRLSGIAYRELDGEIWKELRLFVGMEPEQDDLSLNAADQRRMRELAEREAIQTFTTAELNIEFTANNTIESRMDLDGVVSYLEEQVAERLALAAEGVYI